MINDKIIEEYYKLKSQETQLKKQIDVLRREIISSLEETDTCAYVTPDYTVDIRYFHQTTQAFINFLKQTNNHHLIKETATCSTYEEMKYKYHLTLEQQTAYCVLKNVPYLYITKNRME